MPAANRVRRVADRLVYTLASGNDQHPQHKTTVNSGNTISEDRMPKGIKTVVVGIIVLVSTSVAAAAQFSPPFN
jgi:hypothetical protein